MITAPIIPVWIMLIICIALMIFLIKNDKKKIIPIIIVILLFIINLRPMIITDTSESKTNNLDVLFVVDTTISMEAKDFDSKSKRKTRAINDCKYIAKKLNGARFSLITFNNKSNIQFPYINDINIINNSLDLITTISEVYATGTSLNIPKDDILKDLKSSYKKGNKKRIVFFISDGEITNGDILESYSKLSKYVDGGAVLGYGTKKGGYMNVYDKYSNKYKYIIDYKINDKAVSRIDEKNLKKIAKDLKIEYVHSNDRKKLNKVINNAIDKADNKIDVTNDSTQTDIYYIFILPLIILLLIEFSKLRRLSI